MGYKTTRAQFKRAKAAEKAPRIVPVSEWQKLYDALRDAEELLTAPGAQHPMMRINSALVRIRTAIR